MGQEPDNLHKDLKSLYDKRYRAIGLKDYIDGNINKSLEGKLNAEIVKGKIVRNHKREQIKGCY